MTRIRDVSKVPREQGVLFVERGERYQVKYAKAVEQQLSEFGDTFALANPVIRVIRGVTITPTSTSIRLMAFKT